MGGGEAEFYCQRKPNFYTTIESSNYTANGLRGQGGGVGGYTANGLRVQDGVGYVC